MYEELGEDAPNCGAKRLVREVERADVSDCLRVVNSEANRTIHPMLRDRVMDGNHLFRGQETGFWRWVSLFFVAAICLDQLEGQFFHMRTMRSFHEGFPSLRTERALGDEAFSRTVRKSKSGTLEGDAAPWQRRGKRRCALLLSSKELREWHRYYASQWLLYIGYLTRAEFLDSRPTGAEMHHLSRIDLRLHGFNCAVGFQRKGAQCQDSFRPFPRCPGEAAVVDDDIAADLGGANNCDLCLFLDAHRYLDSFFQLGVLLFGETCEDAASAPLLQAVLERGGLLEVAAIDECTEVFLGGEVDVTGAGTDRSSAVGLDEVDDPVVEQLKVHEDTGHGLSRLLGANGR